MIFLGNTGQHIRDDRGSFTVEASFVVPAVLILICLAFFLNFYIFAGTAEYGKAVREDPPDYCNVHRAISAVFDAGGNIYETLFG